MARRGAFLSIVVTVSVGMLVITFHVTRKMNIRPQVLDIETPNIDQSLQMIFKQLNNLDQRFQKQESYEKYVKYRNTLLELLSKILKKKDHDGSMNPHVIKDNVARDHGINYRLLILVSSNAPHIDRRNKIRSKWGNKTMWTTTDLWRVIFVTGGTKDQAVMSNLHHEAEQCKDLIMEDVEESFYHMSSKVMIGLQWSYTNFNYDYVLKCDDDTFVQVDRIIKFVSEKKQGYFGQLMVGQPVMRKGRYSLGLDEFAKEHFDPYCSGGGFILSYETIGKILPLFNWEKPLKIDDAYIGHLVYKANVSAVHQGGFHMWNRWCEYTTKLLVSHPVKRDDCMEFLMNRSLVENGKLVNDTIKNMQYAYTEEERKKL